jgi:hypothetical protein
MIPPITKRAALLLTAAAFAAFCQTSAADSNPGRRWISEAQAAEPPTWMAAQLRHEVRGRMAHLDARLLADVARGAAKRSGAASLDLELFEDASFGVEVQKIESFGLDGRFVVQGALAENGRRTSGTAILSVVDGAIQAELSTEDGRKFAIRDAGNGLCRVSEMDVRAGIGECAYQLEKADAETIERSASAASQHATSTTSAPAQSGDASVMNADGEPAVVDILIVYTPAFQQAAGSAAAAESRAQLAIAAANQMFEVSGIKSRVRLAAAVKVSYTEGADMSVDLWRLADPTDGHMDEVAQLREQYAADVVHLFASYQDYRRGQATGYPSDYFAVVFSGEASLFTHELGHNFGCQHDRNAAGNGGSSYAFGHVFTAAEDGRKYGCVMSYTGNAGAVQLGRFSSPNLSYKGTPTGIPKGRPDSADNARIVDLTAPMLASMRNPDGATTRMPVFATPPRLSFPMTPLGTTTARQNTRLAFAGASRARPLRVTDFQVTGDADAFLIEIWDATAQQYVAGPNFTIPETGLTLFVRFRPVRNGTAEAAIRFNIDDPAYRYVPPAIQLVGNAADPLLKNISTRVAVGTGEDAMIGGFIVGGDAPREILVRAIGPSLEARGVAGVLADPTLELYRDAQLIAQNDEWVNGFPRESIKWTGAAPIRDLESAVLARLEPGSYTAVVRGHDGGTGVGLVEAYDLESRGGTQLLNISTRGQVQAGERVMIGGFILGGATQSRVLVRALGPSLAGSGVGGSLQDPTLEVNDSQGNPIAANDSWRTENEQAIAETGAPPPDDREAAALLTLPAGAYTAIVRGAGDTSGIGLVEVYKLQ